MTPRERIAAALLAVLLLAALAYTLRRPCPPVPSCRYQWQIAEGATIEARP